MNKVNLQRNNTNDENRNDEDIQTGNNNQNENTEYPMQQEQSREGPPVKSEQTSNLTGGKKSLSDQMRNATISENKSNQSDRPIGQELLKWGDQKPLNMLSTSSGRKVAVKPLNSIFTAYKPNRMDISKNMAAIKKEIQADFDASKTSQLEGFQTNCQTKTEIKLERFREFGLISMHDKPSDNMDASWSLNQKNSKQDYQDDNNNVDEDNNAVHEWNAVKLDLGGVDWLLCEGVQAVVEGILTRDTLAVEHIWTGKAGPKYIARDQFDDNKNVKMVIASGPFIDEHERFDPQKCIETIKRMWEKAPDIALLIGPIIGADADPHVSLDGRTFGVMEFLKEFWTSALDTLGESCSLIQVPSEDDFDQVGGWPIASSNITSEFLSLADLPRKPNVASSPCQLSLDGLTLMLHSRDFHKKQFPHTFFKDNGKRKDNLPNRCKRMDQLMLNQMTSEYNRLAALNTVDSAGTLLRPKLTPDLVVSSSDFMCWTHQVQDTLFINTGRVGRSKCMTVVDFNGSINYDSQLSDFISVSIVKIID